MTHAVDKRVQNQSERSQAYEISGPEPIRLAQVPQTRAKSTRAQMQPRTEHVCIADRSRLFCNKLDWQRGGGIESDDDLYRFFGAWRGDRRERRRFVVHTVTCEHLGYAQERALQAEAKPVLEIRNLAQCAIPAAGRNSLRPR